MISNKNRPTVRVNNFNENSIKIKDDAKQEYSNNSNLYKNMQHNSRFNQRQNTNKNCQSPVKLALFEEIEKAYPQIYSHYFYYIYNINHFISSIFESIFKKNKKIKQKELLSFRYVVYKEIQKKITEKKVGFVLEDYTLEKFTEIKNFDFLNKLLLSENIKENGSLKSTLEYCIGLIKNTDKYRDYFSSVFTGLLKTFYEEKKYMVNNTKKLLEREYLLFFDIDLKSDKSDIYEELESRNKLKIEELENRNKLKIEERQTHNNCKIEDLQEDKKDEFIKSMKEREEKYKNDLLTQEKIEKINTFLQGKSVSIPENSVESFIFFLNAMIQKRHYLEHGKENNYNDITFFLGFLYFLPNEYINKFLQQINKFLLKLKDKIDQEKFDEINKEYEILLDMVKLYNFLYNKKVSDMYSKDISREEANKACENIKNPKYKKNFFKKEKNDRIKILYGTYEYKDHKSKKKHEGKIAWRSYYDNFKELYNKTFNGTNEGFLKISTFKKTFNFIGEKNFKNMEEYFAKIIEKCTEKYNNKTQKNKTELDKYSFLKYEEKKFKSLIKFSYFQDFYSSMQDINLLLHIYIDEIIKDDKENSLDENKSIKFIRNSLKHNTLFCFIEKLKESPFDTIGKKLKELQEKNIEKFKDDKNSNEFSTNSVLESHSCYLDFQNKIKSVLRKMQTPFVYNKDKNKIKVFNSQKKVRILNDKENYFIKDNKKILDLTSKHILKALLKTKSD